jgi:hypothetical protein
MEPFVEAVHGLVPTVAVAAKELVVRVTVKEVEVCIPSPSVTNKVIVDVPVCPATVATLIVLFAPEPPKVILADGTNVKLDEVAVTVNDPAAVSTSPTVKDCAPVEYPLTHEVKSWILVTVGGVKGLLNDGVVAAASLAS